MKKIVAFVMVCGFAVAMLACSQKKENTDVTDSISAPTDTPIEVADSLKNDSLSTTAPTEVKP